LKKSVSSQEMDGLDFSSNKAKVKKHDSLPTVTNIPTSEGSFISPRSLKTIDNTRQSTGSVIKPASSLDSHNMKSEKKS